MFVKLSCCRYLCKDKTFYPFMTDKEKKYSELLPRLQALVEGECEEVSVLANVAAVLHEAFGWWWTGFYLVRDEHLVLGPFQGPPACYRIGLGKGVCGTAWSQGKSIVVDDVESFPGHIACSSASKSEIVIPLRDASGNVCAVLDIDSDRLSAFDDVDRTHLESAMAYMSQELYGNEAPLVKEIYLAGGCFWGVEHYIKQLEGVVDTEVGYANSQLASPTYEDVCSGETLAAETVRVVYDARVLSLRTLLDFYFKAIDPVSVNQQGPDVGTQYRTGIYYVDAADVSVIDEVMADVQGGYDELLAVEVQLLDNFYSAEEYHQDYLVKNPTGYCHLPKRLFGK